MLTSAVFSPARVPVVIVCGATSPVMVEPLSALTPPVTCMLPAKLIVPPPVTSICPGWAPLLRVPVKVTVWPLGTTIVTCPAIVRLRAIVVPDVTFSVVPAVMASVAVVAPRLASPAICSVVPLPLTVVVPV